MELDQAIRTIAASQHGLISRHQLRTVGAAGTTCTIASARACCSESRRAYFASADHADTPAQRALAAVLDVGEEAALSHTSAAAWWQLPGFSIEPGHATRLRGGRVRPSHLATVHQPVLLTTQPSHHAARGARHHSGAHHLRPRRARTPAASRACPRLRPLTPVDQQRRAPSPLASARPSWPHRHHHHATTAGRPPAI